MYQPLSPRLLLSLGNSAGPRGGTSMAYTFKGLMDNPNIDGAGFWIEFTLV